MNKKGAKIIASMLVFIIMFSYMSIVGEVFASQSTTLSNTLSFEAYFKDGEEQKTAIIKNIGEENYLYLDVNMPIDMSGQHIEGYEYPVDGYFKNGTITIDNPNFTIDQNYKNDAIAKIEGNTITLNKIDKAVVELVVPITFEYKEQVSINDICKETKITLSGTHVNKSGKEKKINVGNTVKLAWTSAERKAMLDVDVAKFIQYENSEYIIKAEESSVLNSTANNVAILQLKVNSSLTDNSLPVKEENIEISLPTIDNKKPEEVRVISTSTKMINGNEQGSNFTKDNYTFNQTKNKLIINVKNTPNTEGKIAWKKDAQDEYIVTLIYTGVAKLAEEQAYKITYSADSTLTLMATDTSDAHSTKHIEKTGVTLAGIDKTLVDFEIQATETISKAQMYANNVSTNKQEINYEEKITANIAMHEFVEKITVNQKDEYFTDANGTKLTSALGNNTYIKEITIEKANFDKILGTEGTIKVYSGSTLIATINKDTQADKEGNLVANIADANISSVKVETSSPVASGKLEIKLNKAIKADVAYTPAQIEKFAKMELNTTLEAINEKTTLVSKNIKNEISLSNPETKAELVIDTNNLSTIVENKDVKIKAILNTDTLDCKLYKNPTLKITLPKYIESINIKNIEPLFETEETKLSIKSNRIIANADGTKTIEIVLEGTQTGYTLGSVSKGLNVVITSDITVNKFTPNREENVTMDYTNNFTGAEEKQVTAKVKFVAPTGIVTLTSISNYKDNAETLTAISGTEQMAVINTGAESRKAKLEMNVINNYTNTIDSVVVLGRTFFKGNTAVNTGIALGSTVDMPLASQISVGNVEASKVKIYYSENANATKDLSNTANAWTQTPANLANVKSYLIVVENTTLNTGDGISFNYEVTIPENLQYNQTAYQDYVAYFNNNLPSGKVEDKVVSTKLGITTGRGPVLEASLTSDTAENVEVQTGEIIKYTLTVKNTGTEPAENVEATINVPEGLKYQELDKNEDGKTIYATKAIGKADYKINLGTINNGEKIEKEIVMEVATIKEDSKIVETGVTINSNSIKLEVNKLKNTIVKKYFEITVSDNTDKSVLKENDTYKYSIVVHTDLLVDKIENVVLETQIPEELDYRGLTILKDGNIDISKDIKYNYDKKTRKLTIEIGTLTQNEYRIIDVEVGVNKLPDGVYDREVKLVVKASGNNVRTSTVNAEQVNVSKVGLKITGTSTITENTEITALEDYKYVYTIENLSNIDLSNVKVKDILPKELKYKNMVVTYQDGYTTTILDEDSEGNPMAIINIKGKQKVTIEVNVIADAIEQDTKVTNYAIVSCDGMEDVKSNSISHTVKKYESKPSDEIDKETKRISGQVWEDKNNDGIKDEDEPRMSGVEVILNDVSTNKIVRDENGEVIRVKTAEDGTYTFANLPKGRYQVIFAYDTGLYSATIYHKEGIDSTKNSDAVDLKDIVLEELGGKARIIACTEEIVVSSENIYNIDLGLVENKKFDLKLDKTVSKITVQDNNGTKVYDFKDTKLAKKDLVAKNVSSTTIIVEYKIKVTNEGAIPGYVKKIVDYMPSDMKFSSELNRDWYTSNNKELFNSSLANTVINPGETKEVTLTLSKKMTENNLGIINNTAEIYEAYNDLGLEDIDSKPGNKISTEDDMSSADVVITVKTGEWLMFTGLTITIITILGVGAYFIKKKVLN